MSDFDDDDSEMFRRDQLDDATIDQLVKGTSAAGDELLASFVAEAQRTTVGRAPRPSRELATFLAAAISTGAGDTPAPVLHPSSGAASPAAERPRRVSHMVRTARSRVGALGIGTKAGLAVGALALTGTAAAATGTLPQPVIDVIERTGIEIPGGKSTDHRQDGDRPVDVDIPVVADAERPDDVPPPDTPAGDVDEPDTPAGNGAEPDTPGGDVDALDTPAVDIARPDKANSWFGEWVSARATDGEPIAEGADFGASVSEAARQAHQPAGTPNASDNPGSGAASASNGNGNSQRPANTPNANDNLGSGAASNGNGNSQQPANTPNANDNTGSGAASNGNGNSGSNGATGGGQQQPDDDPPNGNGSPGRP